MSYWVPAGRREVIPPYAPPSVFHPINASAHPSQQIHRFSSEYYVNTPHNSTVYPPVDYNQFQTAEVYGSTAAPSHPSHTPFPYSRIPCPSIPYHQPPTAWLMEYHPAPLQYEPMTLAGLHYTSDISNDSFHEAFEQPLGATHDGTFPIPVRALPERLPQDPEETHAAFQATEPVKKAKSIRKNPKRRLKFQQQKPANWGLQEDECNVVIRDRNLPKRNIDFSKISLKFAAQTIFNFESWVKFLQVITPPEKRGGLFENEKNLLYTHGLIMQQCTEEGFLSMHALLAQAIIKSDVWNPNLEGKTWADIQYHTQDLFGFRINPETSLQQVFEYTRRTSQETRLKEENSVLRTRMEAQQQTIEDLQVENSKLCRALYEHKLIPQEEICRYNTKQQTEHNRQLEIARKGRDLAGKQRQEEEHKTRQLQQKLLEQERFLEDWKTKYHELDKELTAAKATHTILLEAAKRETENRMLRAELSKVTTVSPEHTIGRSGPGPSSRPFEPQLRFPPTNKYRKRNQRPAYNPILGPIQETSTPSEVNTDYRGKSEGDTKRSRTAEASHSALNAKYPLLIPPPPIPSTAAKIRVSEGLKRLVEDSGPARVTKILTRPSPAITTEAYQKN